MLLCGAPLGALHSATSAPPQPAVAPASPQGASFGEIEAQRCQDKIATVQRDVFNHYEDAMQELQAGFQKSADLDGALAVRAERQRLAQEQSLSERNYVGAPKALRALQTQTLSKMQELVGQLVQETVPRLLEMKRQYTVAGKLDEAVAVRATIEQLQNTFQPISRPEAGAEIPADTLLQAYAADRSRADKQYKNQKITVRGVLGGFRQDPSDGKFFLVYLTGGASGNAWVQCSFPTNDYHFKEEKQFNNTVLVITSKEEPGGLRIQKGQVMDIRGVCEGWDDVVKLAKCDLGGK